MLSDRNAGGPAGGSIRPVGPSRDGLTLASLGLLAAVTLLLGRAAIVGVPTALLAAAAWVALARWRPNATRPIAAGAFGGWLLGK